jgi:DNA-binding transcriptional MerR regulator
MSGASVRTLHFYDEVGLLKPAYVGSNGYRSYDEPQLLTLQQILFYRELGVELKRIKKLLGRTDHEKVAALKSHRKVLLKKLDHTRELLVTIDKTIQHLKGNKKMKTQEMFVGFTPEQQAKHEKYLVGRFGPDMEEHIAASKAKLKHWTKSHWEMSGAAFNQICQDLVSLFEQNQGPDSPDAQKVIRRHYEWLKQFWTPTQESYTGHADLITDSDFRKAYEAHHPRLPEFAAAAMKTFARREL